MQFAKAGRVGLFLFALFFAATPEGYSKSGWLPPPPKDLKRLKPFLPQEVKQPSVDLDVTITFDKGQSTQPVEELDLGIRKDNAYLMTLKEESSQGQASARFLLTLPRSTTSGGPAYRLSPEAFPEVEEGFSDVWTFRVNGGPIQEVYLDPQGEQSEIVINESSPNSVLLLITGTRQPSPPPEDSD